MTAITGKIAATRRPGELGIHSMDTFTMRVPDLRVADDFYRAFGLDVREEGNTLGLYTYGSDHRWLSLTEGPKKQLNHLSLAVFDADFAPLRRRIEGRGARLGHVLGSNYFHYVRDPWGSYSEYSADIDYIPHDCDWQSGDDPGEDSIYLWGPEMPADFVHNYEADAG